MKFREEYSASLSSPSSSIPSSSLSLDTFSPPPRQHTLWIFKPPALGKGRGCIVTDFVSEDFLAQKYPATALALLPPIN
jgi:hypothetical protein